MPHGDVLGVPRAQRVADIVTAVVADIEVVRLHEPHQMHSIDAGREPAVGLVDVAAHRLGAGDAGRARHVENRGAVGFLRHGVGLRRGGPSIGEALQRRVDRGVHVPVIGRAEALEHPVAADRVGIAPRCTLDHAEAQRSHQLERQEAAMHPAADPHRLGGQKDVVAHRRRLAEHEITGLALEDRQWQRLSGIDEAARNPCLRSRWAPALLVVDDIHPAALTAHVASTVAVDEREDQGDQHQGDQPPA